MNRESKDVYRDSPLLLVTNVWDAGSARRAAAAGARLIATTSAGVAWANGYSDGEKMPINLLLETVGRIIAAVAVPVSVDIEEGYSSSPDEVASLVEQLVQIGASGINIEDGRLAPELLVVKIESIRARSACADVFINARTDVYLRGLAEPERMADEACRRALLYADAGADGLFVPGLSDAEDIRKVASTSLLPLNVMALPGLPGADELRSLGVRRVSAGPWLAQYVSALTQGAVRRFLDTGSVDALANECLAFEELDRERGQLTGPAGHSPAEPIRP